MSALTSQPLTPARLNQLAQQEGVAAVSLYLPTHRYGREIEQDRIRLENLISEAEARGLERGWSSRSLIEILEPARARLNDTRFWRYQGDGLALLLAPGLSHEFRLREAVDEFAYAGERFCIRPLTPSVSPGDPFWILALSQNRVRLLDCSRAGVREVDLYDIPQRLEDRVGYDFEARSLQFHTGAAPRGGASRAAQFHGQGRSSDKSDEELEEYFRAIDRGLGNLIGDSDRPVLLAAVDYLMPIFRSVSKHLNVLESGLAGNPDHKKNEELHKAGLAVMAPYFESAERKLQEKLEAMSASDHVCKGVVAALPAARAARVQGLLVTCEQPVWGRYDTSSDGVEVHAVREKGDDDLLDLAIAYSLRSGAEVHAVAPDALPENSNRIAALLRY